MDDPLDPIGTADDSLFVIGYVFAVFYGVLLGLFLAAVLTAIGWWW